VEINLPYVTMDFENVKAINLLVLRIILAIILADKILTILNASYLQEEANV